MSTSAPIPRMHTPPAGLAPYSTPTTDASGYDSAPATGPPPDALPTLATAASSPGPSPAALPSPSIAFTGFAAAQTTGAGAAAVASQEVRALYPFRAAANAAVFASSFQTPAAAHPSSIDGFVSTASHADPFGDASESDDPFGDVDASERSWSGEDA